jgi:hypothetical protein
VNQANLQQAEHADVLVDFVARHPESVAVDTLGSEQAVGLVHEDRVIDWHGEFDMTRVARALGLV